MAQYRFGGGPDDYARDPDTLDLLAGVTLRVAHPDTGATITDLLNASGSPVTSVASNADGTVDFFAPLPVVDIGVPDGAGERLWRLVSKDGIRDAIDAAAIGGGSGVSYVVPGLQLTPGVDDGPAIQAAAESVRTFARACTLLVDGNPPGTCYINSLVQIEGDRTDLQFKVPVDMGPNARVRIFGETVELPETDKPKIATDIPSGTSVVPLNKVEYSPGVPIFAPGDYVVVRGLRNAAGKALQREYTNVVSVDTTAKTVTVSPPLEEAYEATYETSPYANNDSQMTVVVSTKLTSSSVRGDDTVTVADSSEFTVGEFVEVLDDAHTTHSSGVEEIRNFIHREMAYVAAVPSGTQIRLSHKLHHGYDHTKNARVAKLRPVVGAKISGGVVTFDGSPSGAQNCFEIRFATHSKIDGIDLVGSAAGSWSSQAFRIAESMYCEITNWSARNPQDVTSSRGYGATLYGATYCKVTDGYADGCRHSVLLFNGSAGCTVEGNTSVNCTISDYDTHGAECVDNLITRNIAAGGSNTSPDSTNRSALRAGNTAHVFPGDNHNTWSNNVIVNYTGDAFQVVPSSIGNTFRDNKVYGASVGFRARFLSAADTRTIVDTKVIDNEFHNVPQPLNVDGGTNSVVDQLLLRGNVWTAPTQGFSVSNATKVVLDSETVREWAGAATGYAVTAVNCPGIQVLDGRFSGGGRFLKLTDCPDFRATGSRLFDMQSTTVYEDRGGNDDGLYESNRFYPGTPVRLNTAPGPSTGGVITL
jgi:hypothetical protein